VYSFSMILYQLFEHQPPFAGTDPVEAARQAALYEYRPPLQQLKGGLDPLPVRLHIAIPPWFVQVTLVHRWSVQTSAPIPATWP